MTLAILTLLSGALGLFVWLLKRRAARHDNPLSQHQARYDRADQEIAREDADAASRNGVADLDALERLRISEGDQRG